MEKEGEDATNTRSNLHDNRLGGKIAAAAATAFIAIAFLVQPLLADPAVPSPFTIGTPEVFRDINETNDFLCVVPYEITYSSAQPATSASRVFTYRFMTTGGATILRGTIPYDYNNAGYGQGIFVFYFPAMMGLSWGAPFIVRIDGTPLYWTSPPSVTHTLSTGEYCSAGTAAGNALALANWVLTNAASLEINWGVKLFDTNGSGGVSLTSTGQAYYTSTIPYLATVCPQIMSASNSTSVFIAFNANGGSGSMSNETENYNVATALTINTFTRTGYTFAGWNTVALGGGTSYANGASYPFTSSVTLYAQWTANANHTLTYTAGPNGTITGSSPQTVTYGSNGTAVTAVPATGYHFGTWSDGFPANTRTDTGVTADVSVTANFAINTFTLTYSAGANGSLTGSSPQTVNYGSNGTAVTAVPATGYHFVAWSDGSTANPRTDINVIANISVTANFATNIYTLTYTAGLAGTITGNSSQTVNSGSNGITVAAVPNANYHFVNWSDGSVANPRTDTNVTANISVTVNFALNTYTITASAGIGGTIALSGAVTVPIGANQVFIITPNAGYQVSNVTIDGSAQGVLTSYMFSNVIANHTISATFSLIPITSVTTTSATTTTTPPTTTTTPPTTTPTPPTTTITPPPTTTVNATASVDVSNDVNTVGQFIAPVTLSSTDSNAIVDIPAGITGTLNNQPLSSVTVTQLTAPPAPPPTGDNIISVPYEFGPSGAQFSSPITMTFSYDPATLPPGVSETSLVIAYYSVSDGQWITLGGVVDTINHTITVQVNHFTAFAVIGGVTATTIASVSTTTSTLLNSWWFWPVLWVTVVLVILGIYIGLQRRPE